MHTNEKENCLCIRVSSDMATYPEGIEPQQPEEPSNDAPQHSNASDPGGLANKEIDDKNLRVSHRNKSHPILRPVVRTAIGLLLFGIVLACVTFSKLTLIRLTDELHYLVVNTTHTSKEVRKAAIFPL